MTGTHSHELGIMGPTTVRAYGAPVPLRPRERDVLAVLGLIHPLPASAAEIIEVLWAGDPPPSAKVSVQNHISRMRRTLGVEAIVTDGPGYRLGSGWSLDTEELDARRAQGRRSTLSGDHAAAQVHLNRARSLARGEAFADLEDSHRVSVARAHRREIVAALDEEYVLALLDAGDPRSAAARAASLVEADPDREARWALLAVARHRDGQRRQALRTLSAGRQALRESAGLDVGPTIGRLESLILDDDPSLGTAPAATLVGHDLAPTPATGTGSEVFVGRTAELDEIRQLLVRAFDHGASGAFEIVGPEGAGTTRFLGRVAVQAAVDGWNVASVTCNPLSLRTMEPFGELIGQILDREPNPEEVFEPALLSDLASLWNQGARRPRGDVGEAILDAMRGHAERFPTLLLVDDSHHLTLTAALLLDRIARLDVPVVVILAHRAGRNLPGPAGSLAVELTGLDLHDTRHLLESVAGAPVHPDMARALYRATGGLPGPICRAARQADRRDGKVGPESSMVAALLGALERESSDLRAVASVLAVGEMALPEATLGMALPALAPSTLAAAILRGVHVGIFARTANGSVRVVDLRLRAELMATLDADEIDDRHEALGRARRQAGELLAAASHLLQVAHRDPDLAVEAAIEAAAVASDGSMFIEAAELQRRAADVSAAHRGPADPQTLRLRLEQAESLRRAGDPDSAGLAWEIIHLAEEAGDDASYALAAAALCRLGPLTEAGTLNEDLAAVVERAVERSPTPAIRANVAGEAVLFYSMSGRVSRCAALFADALDHARVADDDRLLLGVLGSTYNALTHPDELGTRLELTAEMLAVAERLDDDDGRFQALHLYFSNQVQTADPLLRTTFARQEQLASSLRSAGRRWMAGYQRACLAHLEGRLDDSLQISAQTLDQAPVARSRALSAYWINLLVVRLAQGRGQELVNDIDEAVQTQPGLPGWRAVAAWLAALRSDHERVRSESAALDRGRGLPRDSAWSGAALLLGRAVAAAGDQADVDALYTLLVPFRRQVTWIGSLTVGPFDVGLAELALARGDHAEARQHVIDAQRCIDRLQASVYQPELDRLRARLAD